MIFLDTLTVNPDRHTANFGLLRDTNTGGLLGLAPLYDHNMSLISRGKLKFPTSNDYLICLFNDFISEHPEYKRYLPEITENSINAALDKTDMPVENDYIIDLLLKRYELIDR